MFKEEKNELETKRKAWKHKLIGILDCSLCPQCVEDKGRVFNREEGLSQLPNKEHTSQYKEIDCALMYESLE